MKALRSYQNNFCRNLAMGVVKHTRVIACLPTGGGKTVCFCAITDSAIAKGKTVLIVTESRKIFKQIVNERKGVEIKPQTKDTSLIFPNNIYIAMAQTLTKRPQLLEQFASMGSDLIAIVDEAHIGTPSKIQTKLTGALQIGFTATPDYNSAKHLPEIYNDCIVGAQVSDLLQEGFLVPYRHFARVGADLDKLKIKNGEFTEESQIDAFENKNMYDGLIEDLKSFKFKKAMVFCSSIGHCIDTHFQLNEAGFKCSIYHSQQEDKDYQLGLFEYGENDICVSVAALNKGYDFPPIDLTCLVFSTTSLPRYLQSIGRASRIFEGKEMHTCLDYGGNYLRHGLWDMDREWDKMWKATKKKKKSEANGIAPVKMCPKCGSVIPATTLVCQYCGELFEVEQKELQQGELVEITAAFEELRGKLISELTPEQLAIYAKMRNKKSYAIRIARAQQQKEDGWLQAFANAMNYKSGWVHFQLQSLSTETIDFHDIIIK